MAKLHFRRIAVATGTEDIVGLMALVDGRLVALFTRMDADFHDEQRGWWHHDFGFYQFEGLFGTFPEIDDITRWIEGRLALSCQTLDGPVEVEGQYP